MHENGHEQQEHDKSVEILPLAEEDNEPDWMGEKEYCPNCQGYTVEYQGRQQDEHGDWVDHWHCMNATCDYWFDW